MSAVELGPIRYDRQLTFVWLEAGPHGELEAAFVIDGREYPDADAARAAVLEALEQTGLRVRLGEFRPMSIPENEKELAYWPSWTEFRGRLDVYGPVYPWRRPSPQPQPARRTQPRTGPAPASTPTTPLVPAPPPQPLYSERHFECWGQLVEIFDPGRGPVDPVLGRRALGYSLNGYTGEFEADTKRVLQCARDEEDDDTWPLRDEDEFIERVEARREQLLRASFFQQHDKPEILAAYEQTAHTERTAQSRRDTYELWRQAHRRRAYFLVGDEPVRVDLTDDGVATATRRLDPVTGRIIQVSADADDAETLASEGKRITEHAWILAVEELRRTLPVDDAAIAEAYAQAAATDEAYRRRILTRTFDLWARRFADGD